MKSGMSKVSVIIPTYNRADLLALTIDSVLAQTYPALELIVVDDGSTDNTPAVVAGYGERVRYIRQANQGPDAAVANGLAAATGDYINFLDHDDLMMPAKIERQVAVLDRDRTIGLVHCGYEHIDETGQTLQQRIALPDTDILKNLIESNFIWSGGPLIRREWLDTVGLFDETIWCSDWDLWLRFALAGCGFHCIQETLGAYRILPRSIMSNIEELEKGMFAALDKVFHDPRLPEPLHAIQDSVYSRMHFEMSARYYMSHDWEGGNRSLIRFFDMKPALLHQPEALWQYFMENIIKNPRLVDPVSLIAAIFEHLPAALQPVQSYRSRFSAYAHIFQAFVSYSLNRTKDAQSHLEQAVEGYPPILQDPDAFVHLLASQAFIQSAFSPFAYADFVFDNLPPAAAGLNRVRRRAQGDLHVIAAFQAYSTGEHRRVAPLVLKGIPRRPAWLKNKGVSAIFFKSLKSYWAG